MSCAAVRGWVEGVCEWEWDWQCGTACDEDHKMFARRPLKFLDREEREWVWEVIEEGEGLGGVTDLGQEVIGPAQAFRCNTTPPSTTELTIRPFNNQQ